MKILNLSNKQTSSIPPDGPLDISLTERALSRTDDDDEINVYGYDLTDPSNRKFATYLAHIKNTDPRLFNKITSLN